MKLEDCLQPWFEMQFDYHQTIRPCCFYKDDTDNFDFNSNSDLDIKKIWNSSYFQNYRRIITGKEKNAPSIHKENCKFSPKTLWIKWFELFPARHSKKTC